MNEYKRIKDFLRGWIIRCVILLGLVISSAGCASATPVVPTSPLENTETPSAVAACESNKVPVTHVHWFKDALGAWRVVGEIENNSSKPVAKLVTGVETRDKNGRPADQGEDVSAYPLNLQPGAKAPFIAWIDREIPNLDHFEVEVAECVLADQAERGKVDVRAGRMTVDENGRAQVTAELFNPGSKAVLVNGLMAGVYDGSGVLVAADNAAVTTRYLAPGESGPVRATIDLPPGGKDQIKSYQFFMDALVNEPAPLPVDAKRDVKILSHYLDKDGHFHLVGQLTNPGQKGLMVFLQATVYTDANKSAVADAASFDTWVPLGPGETRPFDLSDWGALNNIHTLWYDIQTQNPVIELRFEPFSTWVGDVKPVKLTVAGDNVSFENGQAIFTGKVHADANTTISNGLIIAVVRQKAGGEIVATSSVHLDIVSSTAPGQVLDYQVIVSLPADVDPSTLETEITAVGQ